MKVGLKALKALVAKGTPHIGESALRGMVAKGKSVSVIKHEHLVGWPGMPMDAVEALIVVRGLANLDNVELLIQEFRNHSLNKYHHIDFLWTYVPGKETSAEAIVVHDPEPAIAFDWDSGTATLSKAFLSELIKKQPGIRGEPEIKKVKLA